MRMLAVSECDRYRTDSRSRLESRQRRDGRHRRASFLFVFDLPIEGDIRGVPGANDARVVQGYIALPESREDVVVVAKQLHEIAALVGMRRQFLYSYAIDHRLAPRAEYGLASARRWPYCAR